MSVGGVSFSSACPPFRNLLATPDPEVAQQQQVLAAVFEEDGICFDSENAGPSKDHEEQTSAAKKGPSGYTRQGLVAASACDIGC